MRFSVLFISVCLSIGLTQAAAIDHLPDVRHYNRLTGDKVSIERGHLDSVAFRKAKRDYATALDLLKAAVANFQQSEAATAPVEQTPPPPVEEVAPPPVEEVAPPPVEEVAPPPVEEVAPPPAEEIVIPPVQEASPIEQEPSPPSDEPAPAPDEPVAPPTLDIEEDDKFDPEEDPDDVDDPPILNGVPNLREE